MGGRGGFGTQQGCGGNGGKGRIRVDAAIFKGSITPLQGVFTQSTLQNEFIVSTFKAVYKGHWRETENEQLLLHIQV